MDDRIVCNICDKTKHLNVKIENLESEVTKLRKQVTKYKYDSMTGLLGRADFNEEFDNLWHEHTEFGHNFMLAIIDLNGLHLMNRVFGFGVGDRFIINTANIIKELFEDSTAYRTSGDEFFILKRGTDIDSFYERLTHIPDAEYCAVESISGYNSPTEMFNYCDSKVVEKKKKNHTEREE